nr:hypothetical protein [Microvirga roseola]
MHDIDLTPEVSPLRLGGERQPLGLLDRQRVHVSPQRHNRAGLRPYEHGNHSGAHEPGLHVEPDLREMFRHKACCSELLPTEF